MLTLRDYQSDIVDRTRDALRAHRAVLIQSATGSGKTALAAYMIARAAERGRRAWFLCHRDFLLTQTSAALDAAGVPHGFIAAGREFNPYQRVAVAGIDTLRRRLDRLTPPDLIVWDEAHHVGAKTWGSVYAWAGDKCRHVGLSATPARLDGRGLDKHFGAIVNGPTVAWLIARNYLSRYRAYAPSAPDLGSVGRRGGDYAADQLAGVMDTGQIAGNIVGTYQRLASGKRAIYYAVSVDHSNHLAATFRSSGINAQHLDASSGLQERVDASRDLADGKLSIITNVDLFGEGFDLNATAGRDVALDCVGLCRPTQSLTLHLQQCGRALRPKPESAIILDHAGNLMRHGLPDDDRTWTLAGVNRKGRQVDTGPAVRMCEACYGVFSASTRICPYCGAQAALTPREVEEVAADLVEADRELMRAARKREEQRAKTLTELIAVGYARGYAKPEGWAKHVIERRSAWRGRQATRTPSQDDGRATGHATASD